MRSRLLVILINLLIISFGLSLNAAEKWDKVAKQRKSEYIYMEALRRNALGDEDCQYELMKRANELDSSDTYVTQELGFYTVALAAGQKDYGMLEDGYAKMAKHFKAQPQDYYGSYLYGDISEKIYKYKEALEVWRTLDSIFPHKTDVSLRYADLSMGFADSANVKKAISVYSRIENTEGKSIMLTSRKMRGWFTLKDTVSALNEMSALLKAQPRNSYHHVFAGETFAMLQENDSALYYLNKACELDSTNGSAYLSRAKFYNVVGDSVAYDREVFKALKLNTLDVESKLELMTEYIRKLYTDSTQHDRIDNLLAVLIEQHPHEKDIHELYFSYLIVIKDYPRAIEQAGYVLDIDPSNEELWRAKVGLLSQIEEYDKAIAEGEKAIYYHPENPSLHIVMGTTYSMMKEYDKAIKYLDSAFKLTNEYDFKTLSDILCTKGDIYYMSGVSDSAFIYYDKAIMYEPGNLLALNNCAYYLACENRDLDRAESMIKTVVREEPENGTYLDTYAWVLFKKADYKNAKIYIDKTLELSDDSSVELLHHAGDIYFMVGLPSEALDFWKQALELEPENELLQRKVKHKTYFYE